MLAIGRALRVVVHLNADVSSTHEFLHNDILAFLYENGVAGATVFRPRPASAITIASTPKAHLAAKGSTCRSVRKSVDGMFTVLSSPTPYRQTEIIQ